MSRPHHMVLLILLVAFAAGAGLARAGDRPPPPSTLPADAVATDVTVLTPAGAAAHGARAVLVPVGSSVIVLNGERFEEDAAHTPASAGDDGRLHFPATAAPFLIVVIHETGSAHLEHTRVAGGEPVRLEAWGRVEGQVSVAGKPVAGRKVMSADSVERLADHDPGKPQFYFASETATDDAGRYVLPRMRPGLAWVGPAVEVRSWGGVRPVAMRYVRVASGGATPLDFGNDGRPVTGRVVVPAEVGKLDDVSFGLCSISRRWTPLPSPMPAALNARPLSEQAEWWARYRKTPEAQARADLRWQRIRQTQETHTPFDIAPDGSFRIEDVRSGDYVLSFQVRTAGDPTTRQKLGEGELEFTVPPIPGGRSDKPLDLPPITAVRRPGLRVGDVAPDFTVDGLDDRPVKLSDHRGKYVLLEFWATWCGSCVYETPHLKKAFDTFGRHPGLQMISISSDEEPHAPTAYVAEHGLGWTHGYTGMSDAAGRPPQVQEAYGVLGIPSIWLIGPDGRVVARGLRGEQIVQELTTVLSR